MVLGDKKLFDIFIGKQLRHYLEDKDRMALARQFGITRQEYEAPPGTVKWLQGRGQVAIRGPPRGPPPTLLAMSHPRMHYVVCHYCHSQGHPHPDYPDLPEEHRPGCPCLRPPRRHGPRRGGEYPYRRTRRRGRRPAHHPYDTDLDDDIDMFTEFEEDMESDFGDLDDFEEDIDDGAAAVTLALVQTITIPTPDALAILAAILEEEVIMVGAVLRLCTPQAVIQATATGVQ
ncbi:MAG: hypothetical protein LQ346_006085 [Caloplaca aetnensis]|nr:MAG: hypothetical protein LQ346_006085 [Caloplaca aetnensis]